MIEIESFYTLISFSRSFIYVKVKFFSKGDINTAKTFAYRGSQRTFQCNFIPCNGINSFLREWIFIFIKSAEPRLGNFPVNFYTRVLNNPHRSEERRVGKECRSR